MVHEEPPSPAQDAQASAQALLREGKVEDALRAIDDAIAMAPDNPRSHWLRGQIRMHPPSRSPVEVEEAIASYRRATQGRCERGGWFADLAQALLEAGRDDEAIALMQSAAESAIDDVAAHADNWLGWYYTSRRPVPERAFFYCTRAVERLPTWGTTWLNLAYVEDRLGRHRDAYLHYREAALRPSYDLPFAEERAFGLFCMLAAATLEANLVALSPPGKVTFCAVVAPNGGHLMVARRFTHGFGVNMPNGKGLPAHPHEAAEAVQSLIASDDVSMTEVAAALCVAVRDRLKHETLINIPQAGPDFVEVHLKSEAVYVHFDHRDNGVSSYDASGERLAVVRRTDLAAMIEKLLQSVQHQLDVFARAPALEEQMKAFSEALLQTLRQRLQSPDDTPFVLSAWGEPTSRRYSIAWGDMRRRREVAVVSIADGRISATIGRKPIPFDSLTVDHAAESVAETLNAFSEDHLVEGLRYRLKRPLGGRNAGEVLTFELYDERDNHWHVYVFRADDGAVVELEGRVSDHLDRDMEPV